FSMALSAVLGESNLKADRIETTATATFEKTDAGFTVTKINLDVTADIPNADNAAFQAAAEKAEKTCPISRLLAAASITMEPRLSSNPRTGAARAKTPPRPGRSRWLVAGGLVFAVALGTWLRMAVTWSDPDAAFLNDSAFHWRMIAETVAQGGVPARDLVSEPPAGRDVRAYLPVGMYGAAALFHRAL